VLVDPVLKHLVDWSATIELAAGDELLELLYQLLLSAPRHVLALLLLTCLSAATPWRWYQQFVAGKIVHQLDHVLDLDLDRLALFKLPPEGFQVHGFIDLALVVHKVITYQSNVPEEVAGAGSYPVFGFPTQGPSLISRLGAICGIRECHEFVRARRRLGNAQPCRVCVPVAGG